MSGCVVTPPKRPLLFAYKMVDFLRYNSVQKTESFTYMTDDNALIVNHTKASANSSLLTIPLYHSIAGA